MITALEEEVDRNFTAFEAVLPALMRDRAGAHALLRHAEIVGFYDTVSSALAAGRSRFDDGLYSVQEVTDRPIDLGFYSHAINTRLA